ncbi:UV-B-induced protein [Camellia lanceoleosa]|uniref:UV-B-induced protein n=1 Tax=Camellia lanceoleosa TaxID=1840588 RepID=A0ACC0HMD6_9ERIC|nr:UV-B-induced protein [Camellia lanceoleosa]
MDYCLSYNIPFVLVSLPSAVKKNTLKSSSQGLRRLVSTNNKLHFFGDRRFKRRALIAVASADCEFSSLNTPLEPKSFAGKFLSRVLQNDLDYFHVAVGKQLEQLAADRDEAVARMNLSLASDEAALHRRIAELREHECEIAVEDVMYMLVLHKFSEIRVHLVPRLSRCIYNGRLEIWPSKDWELESIHNFEVLEMIREHLTAVIGWRADSNVTDNWATTQIPRLQLCGVYAASILYGYFLKSISLRHHLELSVAEANCDLGITCRNPLPQSELWSCGIKNIAFGRISNTQSIPVGQDSCSRGKKREKLRRYIMGFDPETLQMRAKPKTQEVVNLVEKHSCALFGDEKTGLIETNEVILTSLSSLKRIVLEAVAFGSFLWDTEEYVDAVYKLKEN